MSDSKPVNVVSSEQAATIGGGGTCTPSELIGITDQLIAGYENLIDFASHVMTRVSGGQ